MHLKHWDIPLGANLMILTILALLLGACSRLPQGNAANGGRWYSLNRCNGCHGERGSGGRGPMIAGTALSFHRFLGKIRSPRSEIMPAFTPDRLSDQDAADIYLWLHANQFKEITR